LKEGEEQRKEGREKKEEGEMILTSNAPRMTLSISTGVVFFAN
jgi:hypothetical protein